MKISIICPVYNEEKYIDNIILFYKKQCGHDFELILVDGGSTDGTIDIIKRYINSDATIRLYNNPNKIVSSALNIGIKNSIGDILIRIDAHSYYEVNYVESILDTFKSTGADIVGGPTRFSDKLNTVQNSMKNCFHSVFGMGNSSVHNISYSGYTDSVTFGSWKKEIFHTTGMFDENLNCNQDDDFHYRANILGFKIFQNPEIKLYYVPRNTWGKIFKQYFRYGFYKPYVLVKNFGEIKIRHIIPGFFSLYLIFLLPLLTNISYLFILPFIFYIVFSIYFSFNYKSKLLISLSTMFTFFVVHFSYGLGTIFGMTYMRKKRKIDFI